MDPAKENRATLQGYVMALDWDEEDYPTVVSVMVEDGTEYEVEEGEIGDGLLGLEGAEVEVTGLLDRSEDEYPTIQVESFRVLYDPFAEEDDVVPESAADGPEVGGLDGEEAHDLDVDPDDGQEEEEGGVDPDGDYTPRRRMG